MMNRTRPLLILGSLCLWIAATRGQAQQHNPFGEIRKANQNSTLNMHLCPKGEFKVAKDKWGKIVRVNMLKIKDWSNVPGVKKAWTMKGYEGTEGMAFHPVISEVKDVDGDGKVDIFRCRSEHEGARIERLRYDDGRVVWASDPMAPLHGDESRLPVFDLHGEGGYSVLHATKGGTWCISAKTGKTEWRAKEAVGDITVGHFLDRKKQAVLVRSGGVLRCYDDKGKLAWMHDTGLKGGAAYSHELYRHDADRDGLDEIFANWQKLTVAMKGDGTILWEDRTQVGHSDYIVCGDVDADGKVELVYDHHGCGGRGPAYIADAMTGKIKIKIDYRKDGLAHAQNMALGDFVASRRGLEIAMCGKNGGLFMWDAKGELVWKRAVPTSLLSKGDWDGDGVEDISCHALGANVDGMFSVWNGKGQRLYAISFLPSPSRRTWSNKHNGGSWSHAMPGGHEGVRRQVDLDGNGRADFIVGMGAWHWGSDSILFLMEGGLMDAPAPAGQAKPAEPARGTTYYLDADGGDDSKAGTSSRTAWKSLARASRATFGPGDRILLKAGCTFTGHLGPQGSGAKGKPIVIDKYGSGPRPIDRYTAMTFMTFLANWNEKLNFYSGDWNGKHNNGVPLFMPHLMLDHPYMRASTVYNWRHCPTITRDKDGRVKVNKVIYHTESCPFTG